MMNTQLPRSEYPRPQFVRSGWVNLNGTWTFDIGRRQPYQVAYDGVAVRSAQDGRHFQASPPPAEAASAGFKRSITVPFAPESPLSGVGEKDLTSTMWYHRSLKIPADWSGKKILLHFGAVFYHADIYIDGVLAGVHSGGSVSFSLDITPFAAPGADHQLVVGVTNNLWDGSQPSGKQTWKHDSYACYYTRVTGIWQTVWMEAVHPLSLAQVQLLPDLDSSRFVLIPRYHSVARGSRLTAQVSLAGVPCGKAEGPAFDGGPLVLDLKDPRPWSPEQPTLYDIELTLRDLKGAVLDTVKTYGGLRKIHVEGNQVFLNNKPYYQRLVLDQGFYPDGIWTAPSDEALKRDIQLSKDAGFNGARLHQKVFEERFYYWADTLGYLCWGETPSWGLDYNNDGFPARNFMAELKELVVRDRNHPSIVAWTPFNETYQYNRPRNHQRIHEEAYRLCKDLDPTRPVNDSSGYIHHITDLWTVHSYTQDPKELAAQMALKPDTGPYRNFPENEPPYAGQPYLVDEFGGIKWDPSTQGDASLAGGQNTVSWGYGKAPQSLDEFYARLEGQVRTLVSLDHICGWCYTQLTDVEQEQNGVYFYDRRPKFDMERIRKIFTMAK